MKGQERMSTTEDAANVNLQALLSRGTSPWLDFLQRSMIASGELERLTSSRSIRGVTSNPSIFAHAILESADYDDQISELAESGADARAIYEQLTITDVRMACDVLMEVWSSSAQQDGFVSLEVLPDLAHDADGTISAARDLWARVGRPNVMIKIPATRESVHAIEECVYEGININITLLFAVRMYEQVVDAYLSALERRVDAGRSAAVGSVASFFVSRLDTVVDKQLAESGHTDLEGTAAVANARHAYQSFEQLFSGPRWLELQRSGAQLQRPLWASTGVKNPAYPDTMYVEQLAGPHSVCTMPTKTLEAVADHGIISSDTVRIDPSGILGQLGDAGIDLQAATDQLLIDGISQFQQATNELLVRIEKRRVTHHAAQH
jgi:transaldolase